MTTRERILEAALACFTEDGYERTTVAKIRERSGVSNGALFHHFPSKEAIAGALYVDAMRSVQAGHWELLAAEPATLAEAVKGSIAHQLTWTQENPEAAAFLYSQGRLDWSSDAGAELTELNRDLGLAYRDSMRRFVESGEAREMSIVMLTAIVTGPAHAIAQRWLAGQLDGPLVAYVDELSDAAVAGLSGTPVKRRRRPAARPSDGRVRMQLLGRDGAVIAEGEAVAELVAVPPAS